MKARHAAFVVVLSLAAAALAGQWISPDVPAGARETFAPVPLFWFRVARTPRIYRRVIDVAEGCDRATALLRTSGYAYVCVDGRQVFSWGVEKDSAEKRTVPGDPARVHELDLSEYLAPGRHVVTVSAPAGGFVLDGAFYEGPRRLASLASDVSWTVTAFRPTEIVEDHAIMTPGYTGRAEAGICTAAVPVRAGAEKWIAPADALAAAYFRASASRLERDLVDAAWRLELLAKKGLYIVDGQVRGWAGARRPTIASAVRRATAVLIQVQDLAEPLQKLTRESVGDTKALSGAWRRLADLRKEVRAVTAGARGAETMALQADEAKAAELAARHPRMVAMRPATPAEFRRIAAGRLDHPLGALNESRTDRLGWLPHPNLSDSDLARWGIRVNPITGATTVGLRPRWRFRTDPRNTGLGEKRHTVGYNIEDQWPWLDGQQSWTRNKTFAGYRGTAWYRTRVHIPAEWAGHAVAFRLRIAGTGRVWLNDREITRSHSGGGGVYTAPADAVMSGSDNCLAVRVEATGRDRGLIGPAEASCPTLDGPAGKSTPAVDVLAGPLSPCVVLTPRTASLHIHHAGLAELLLPAEKPRTRYNAARDGRLKANWALLRLSPAGPAGADRAILLVFQANPAAISCRAGVTTVALVRPGQRVIAVRPILGRTGSRDGARWQRAASLWSQAALAVPVNYLSLTRVHRPGQPWADTSLDNTPAGPVLEHTVIYDYLETADEWGTKPLKLAPLPAPCSLAVDTKFRGLEVDGLSHMRTVQAGGIAGPYRVAINRESVTYRYPIEPWPRFVGFTSWMFAGSDTGVPGNRREMEIIAATGANSYRPQNNFSDERATALGPREQRTRIQVLADCCRDVGVNFMNNIDQTLGAKREQVRGDYDGWVRTRLMPHYDKLVPQLKDRPFWQVAYDLINEPFDHQAVRYNPVIRRLTERIRRLDRRHLCYVEPCQAWGAIQQLRLIEPTGDPLTMYSFHDYNFRLKTADDRWPTLDRDVSDICRMWWPAFEFAIRHGVGMHCGEYGGFGGATDDRIAQTTLMNDFLRIFDQFGMHHHYYTGRGIYRRQLDGSLRPSNVVRTFRRYTARPDLNRYYAPWPVRRGGEGRRR